MSRLARMYKSSQQQSSRLCSSSFSSPPCRSQQGCSCRCSSGSCRRQVEFSSSQPCRKLVEGLVYILSRSCTSWPSWVELEFLKQFKLEQFYLYRIKMKPSLPLPSPPNIAHEAYLPISHFFIGWEWQFCFSTG